MSFGVGGGAANDNYRNDIKPNQSVTPFNDSISHISWSANGPYFATASWDSEIRLMEVQAGYQSSINQKAVYKFPMPALKCAWNDNANQLYVGLMDGTIKAYDMNTGQVGDIGRHNAAISSLHYIPGQNVIVSTGYENTVQFWQPGNQNPVLSINADQKIFTTDFQFPMLVAGMAGEKMMFVDINNSNNKSIVDSNDLGKNSQIQSIAINNKTTVFGVASFDGRANLSNITKNVNGLYAPKSIITFKSNKQEEGGSTILYPINSVGFNPVNDKWFMTAGSDGGMHFWDYEAKNKIKTLNYGMPICCAKVSPKGEMIAIALGNDWHVGAEGASKWQTKLGVHAITDNETKFNK